MSNYKQFTTLKQASKQFRDIQIFTNPFRFIEYKISGIKFILLY